MAEEYQKKLDELRKKYQDKVAERTTRLNDILNKAKATYDDANDYSIKTGETLSETLLNGITDDLIFDGKLPYGAAKEIIFPMIHDNYELVTKYCEGVQNALNEQANIHLKYVKPEFAKDRAYGLINAIHRDEFAKIKNEYLGESLINQSQDIVTESVKVNAKFQYETGMRPKIVRTVAGGCCDWCANLAGTYDYESVKATGNEVWRRHRYCRCTVTYDPGNGKRVQNAHSKKWVDREEIENRIILNTPVQLKYCKSVKKEWLKKFDKDQAGVVVEKDYWEVDGIKYYVDGHSVVQDHTPREKEVANIISNKLGVKVELNPEVKMPKNHKTPDYTIKGINYDLKEINGAGKHVIDNAVSSAKGQANNVVIDITKTKYSVNEAFNKIDEIFRSNSRKWLETMMIVKNDEILDILSRK